MDKKANKKTKYIFEKTLDVFAWLCLALAIILSVVTIFASMSGEDNGEEIFGCKMLIVNTDSMSKSATSLNESVFFNAGDVIFIKRVESAKDLKVGDVITFFSYNPESMGKTVSHKIREIKYNQAGDVTGIVTYGINTGVNDIVEVKPEHLIGRYEYKIPRIGRLFSFLQTPRGFYLSILIPGVLLIIFFSVKVGKILGKQEYAKLYNGEIDSLKTMMSNLEEKGGSTQMIEENTTQSTEQNTEQPKQEQHGQATPAIYQTVSITYQATPFAPQPVIYQTALEDAKPVHQSITIAPLQTVQPAPVFYPTMPVQPQPVIYQTAPGQTTPVHQSINMNPAQVSPAPFYYATVPFAQQPVICQTIGANAPTTPTTVSNHTTPVQTPSQTVCQSVSGITPAVPPVPTYYQTIPFAQQPVAQKTDKENLIKPTTATEETVATEILPVENNEKVEVEPVKNKFDIPDTPKKPFAEKLIQSKKETQNYFNTIHNQLTSYKKVSSRISLRCASYRKGRTLLAKISLRGKTLTGYFNLDVNDFNEKIYFQKDLSNVKAYEEVPFAVKIRSDRACNNAIKLVSALADKFELKKDDKFEPKDNVKIFENKK